jgi:hypothetical protein
MFGNSSRGVIRVVGGYFSDQKAEREVAERMPRKEIGV